MDNFEITLDKIELVKDRTGVSYREAKEALEKSEGNVVDAIVGIEDTINSNIKKDSKVNELVADVKEAVRKGNVAKIVIKKGDDVVLNLPVNVGLIGTVLFPWATLAGVIAAFGTKCTIELFRENGEVVNVSEKAGDVVETVVSKGGVVLDEAKDKGSDLFSAAKEKGGELFSTVVEKSGDLVDAAKDKSGDLMEMAKSKAADIKAKAPKVEPIKADDFDLSDLELDEMEPLGEEVCDKAEEACCEAAEKAEEVCDKAEEACCEAAEKVEEACDKADEACCKAAEKVEEACEKTAEVCEKPEE